VKEASWDDCLYSNSSVKITPDKGKAKSLIETAEERIKFTNKELNENTINYIFEDYYSSILEIVHAIVILKGFKVNNHICLGFFIRDVLNREDLFRIFDDCRFKRNSLTYYGKRMNFEIAKDAIEKSRKLLSEFKKILKEEVT